MARALRVHLLPETLADKPPAKIAVVIDVLRASTTITEALAAGAVGVIPCQTVEDAHVVAASWRTSGPVVLGGEREGLAIEGFDLGNSPAEYTTEAVGGKTAVFTTTNGTKALDACRGVGQVYLAAAVNRQAVCDLLRATDAESIDLVCAGTDGRITREDVLIAGAIIDQLQVEPLSIGGKPYDLDDTARLALSAWRELVQVANERNLSLSEHLAAEFRDSAGGRNLIAIGHESDLALAAKLDSTPLVPALDSSSGIITAHR